MAGYREGMGSGAEEPGPMAPPVGVPMPMSARLVADELDQTIRALTHHRDAFLVGHAEGMIESQIVTAIGDLMFVAGKLEAMARVLNNEQTR